MDKSLVPEENKELLVAQLKTKFYEKYVSTKDLYNDEDVTLFLENEEYRYLERYLERTGMSVEKALVMLENTLKWRKEKGLTGLTDSSFPPVFYKYGLTFLYEDDRNGNLTMHMRCKLTRKYHPAAVDIQMKLIFYQMLKVDQLSSSRKTGWVLFFDMSSFGVSQWDLKNMFLIIRAYDQYFGSGFKGLYLFGLGLLQRSALKTVLAALPSKLASLVVVIKEEDLFKYIAQENLPQYLGGTCNTDPRVIPRGCPEDEEYFRQNYFVSQHEFRIMYAKYEKVWTNTDW